MDQEPGVKAIAMLDVNKTDLLKRHKPVTLSDRFAFSTVSIMAKVAAALFGERYGNRAIVLETVAAVPAMVSATLLHLRCLRLMMDDRGWIRTLMVEAENQRAHLMSFVALRRPSSLERLFVVLAQGIFYNSYFLLRVVSPATAYRLAGYMSEQAIQGYTRELEMLSSGEKLDIEAPAFAVDYWNLRPGAKLSEMLTSMRQDEAIHRDIQHAFADASVVGESLPELPSP
jgi:ubiquinol oxidase